jgi:TonB family protein
MRFKFALIISIILHFSIFALVFHTPRGRIADETTYYVDLVHLPSGGFSGKGPGGTGAGKHPANVDEGKEKPGASLVEEPAASIKDLTVQKEIRSKLRYPDKNGKKKDEEKNVISVVRKPLASVKRKSDQAQSGTEANASRVLTTGISSSGGEAGFGDGTGDGIGGSGLVFPYAYYIDMLRGKISASWYNSLISPGLRGKYEAVVYFRILRNGNIERLKLEKDSGITSLDLSALRAIENASPFAPLPPDFPSSYLVVHFKFEWEK